MKLPTFDITARTYAWDRYSAFHVTLKNADGVEIVQFDTGEALVRVLGSRPDLDGRTHHTLLGIRVATTTNDENCPQCMLEDGTLVPRAWYGGQMQTLLIDDDTRHVVGIGGSWTLPYGGDVTIHQKHVNSAIAQGVPARFTRLAGGFAWFAGSGRVPVSNRPIALYRPNILSNEVWKQARAYRAAAVAWVALEGKSASRHPHHHTKPLEVMAVVQYPTFGDIPPIERTNLAIGGLTAGTTLQMVSSLRVAR